MGKTVTTLGWFLGMSIDGITNKNTTCSNPGTVLSDLSVLRCLNMSARGHTHFLSIGKPGSRVQDLV